MFCVVRCPECNKFCAYEIDADNAELEAVPGDEVKKGHGKTKFLKVSLEGTVDLISECCGVKVGEIDVLEDVDVVADIEWEERSPGERRCGGRHRMGGELILQREENPVEYRHRLDVWKCLVCGRMYRKEKDAKHCKHRGPALNA